MAVAGTLSNALTNALKSVAGNVTGLINGQNPLTQPQIARLIGFNIPAAPLVSTRDYFLTQLQSWISTPSLQSQWIAVIDRFPPALSTSILQNLERTAGNINAYDINLAKLALTLYPFQYVTGCLFCNSFEMPEEKYSVEEATLKNNRGFIPGVVASNRAGYAGTPLVLGFYDNNTTFTDFIIRPWVMLASHYGHVTRKDPKYSVKCNITLMSFSKTYNDVSMVPRKVFTFFNCVPTLVTRQEYSYDEPNEVKSYTTNFSFTNYTIQNNMYLPIKGIIDSVNAGQPFFSNPFTF